MEGLLFLGIMVALAVFSLLALTFGVDSRPGSDDPRVPARGISL